MSNIEILNNKNTYFVHVVNMATRQEKLSIHSLHSDYNDYGY